MRIRPFATLLACACLAALVGAQTEAQPTSAEKTGWSLTPEQLEERLDGVKTELLPRVWPPKCEDDVLHRRKYLAKWQVVASKHYLVFTNGPTTSCKKYAVTLEDLYDVIQKELPFEDLDRPLIAYIFADPEDYYRYCVAISGFSEQGARATAGHANAQFYATYYSSPRSRVVFHEATHEIVGACLKVSGVGSWFQEGIAVDFENTMCNESPDGGAKNDIRHGDFYPLAEFFAIQSLLSDPKGNGRRNYMHAGALLDFMIHTKLAPVAGKFPEFLAAARRGYGFARGADTSERLIQAVYGLSVEQFEALWHKHLKVR